MSEKSPDEQRIAKLLDGFVEQLQAMPDPEVLAGESPEAVRTRATARLARATQEAGRRRMAAARIQAVHVGQAAHAGKGPAKPVSVAEARSYIARVAQDGNYTLAARQLEEMPESELLRLYEQLRELEDEGPAPA